MMSTIVTYYPGMLMYHKTEKQHPKYQELVLYQAKDTYRTIS